MRFLKFLCVAYSLGELSVHMGAVFFFASDVHLCIDQITTEDLLHAKTLF